MSPFLYLTLFIASACAWMGFIVYLGEMLKIKVGVDLRGADIGVAKQFLNPAQILTGLKYMGCKAVAEQMRVYPLRDTGIFSPVFHPGFDHARTDASTADADKQGYFVLLGEQGPNFQPTPQSSLRFAPDRYQALFAAFTRDVHEVVAEINVLGVQADEFRESQSGRIQQFKHCAVTFTDRVIAADVEQAAHLFDIKYIG